ncbi:guanylate kinase [Streptomyces sp. BK340]|uniref:guanylate kinase n=1 Tax=Streptomyces sp. BK340 TaxID=2572903 RepID=UPI0011A8CF48|nr:AAA family ATPase [Streptomyces sp. BK340]TVZ84923.1 guanylate kinase [Streptomyces sp. BK340]
MPSDTAPFLTAPSGLLFVLSGPSGTGKTSLAQALVEADPALGHARSVTTRKPRPGWGEEHFDHVSRDEFLWMVADGEFAHWFHPSYDEYCGTLRTPLERALSAGRDLVFDYCPEGYLNLKRCFPGQTVGVFVMAPSVELMDQRLAGRGSENTEERELRHARALRDFNFVDQHDYHVVNDEFGHTLETLRAIRRAEKARLCRQQPVLDAYARYAEPTMLRYHPMPAPSSCPPDHEGSIRNS